MSSNSSTSTCEINQSVKEFSTVYGQAQRISTLDSEDASEAFAQHSGLWWYTSITSLVAKRPENQATQAVTYHHAKFSYKRSRRYHLDNLCTSSLLTEGSILVILCLQTRNHGMLSENKSCDMRFTASTSVRILFQNDSTGVTNSRKNDADEQSV